jgi:uncharacterized membrane protein
MGSDPEEPELSKHTRKKRAASCVGIGLALGLIFGAAFGNVGLGLVLGIALGAAATAFAGAKRPKNKS